MAARAVGTREAGLMGAREPGVTAGREPDVMSIKVPGANRKAALIILAALLVALLAHEVYYNYLADDAFISFRYVQNLVKGHGLVYNLGERVEGYTNFLWIMLISLPASLGLDPVGASRLLGGLLSLLTVVASYLFSKSRCGTGPFSSLIAPALLVANAAFAAWALSGMETLLFTFLVFLAFCAFVNEWHTNARMPLSAFLFALAALARPEAILFFAISALFRCGKDLRREKRLSWESLAWVAGFIVVYLPYFVWRWNYYGWLLPNTFYAKVGGGYLVYLRGLFYTLKFVSAFGGLLVFALLLGVFLNRRVPFWAWYALALSSAHAAYIIYVGGDGLVISRFFVPILPLIYLLVAAGFQRIASGFAVPNGARRKAHTVAALLAVVMLAGTLSSSYNIRRDPYSEVATDRETVSSLAMAGQWLKTTSGPGESVALYAAGALPYYSELYTIDMYGLTDEYIAHKQVVEMGSGSAGHEKRDWTYVLSRKPTYIVDGMPTPKPLTREPMVVSDTQVYISRSVRIGEGKFWDDFELHSGDLWFNYWELSAESKT